MTRVEPNSFVYFGSGSGGELYHLSNLNHAPVTLALADITDDMASVNPALREWIGDRVLQFATIEHIWQALKATNQETFLQFAANGRFDRFDSDAFAQFGEKCPEKKLKYWSAKNNRGIIPKLASNPKHGKRLGIAKSMNYERERNPLPVQRSVWLTLLLKKYAANAKHKRVLLATGNKKLIEFARSAARDGFEEFWGGCVVDATTMRGENFMGQMMETAREKLKV